MKINLSENKRGLGALIEAAKYGGPIGMIITGCRVLTHTYTQPIHEQARVLRNQHGLKGCCTKPIKRDHNSRATFPHTFTATHSHTAVYITDVHPLLCFSYRCGCRLLIGRNLLGFAKYFVEDFGEHTDVCKRQKSAMLQLGN